MPIKFFLKNKYSLLIILVAVFYCRDAFFDGHVLIREGDQLRSIYTSMIYFHEWTHRGVWPLWSVLSGCGFPFGASTITPLNLYHVASLFFNPNCAYNGLILLNLILNGILVFLFLRRRQLSSFAACLGGLVWMISTRHAIDSGFFFLPLGFYLADLYIERNTRRRFIALTFCLAAYALNAHPQFFIYGSAFLFAYLAVQQKNHDGSFSFKKMGQVASAFVLAILLGAFHFLRLSEWTGLSSRDSWNVIYALLPTHLPLMVFPNLFQHPTQPDLGYIVPRAIQWLLSQSAALSSIENYLSPPYMGILSVAAFLTGASCFWNRKKTAEFFFLVSMLVALSYLMLHPLFYLTAIRHVPILRGITNVGRLFDVYQFSLAALAAYAADWFIRQREGMVRENNAVWRVFVILILLVVVAVGLGRASLFFFQEPLKAKIALSLNAANEPNIFISDVAQFQKQRVEEFFAFFRGVLSWKNLNLWLPILKIFILFFALGLYRRRKIRETALKIFIIFFLLADLGTGSGFSMPHSRAEELRPQSALADFIKKDKGLYRVIYVEDKTKSSNQFFLVPQINWVYGLATPDAYEPLYGRRYAQFYTLLTRTAGWTGYLLHPTHELDENLADFVNAKYLVTSSANPKFEGSARFKEILRNDEYRIYQNQEALPRAFVVRKTHLCQTEEEMRDYVRQYPERLKSEVVLLESSARALALPSNADLEPGEVTVDVYEPNRIQMTLDLKQAGYLVCSETYFPGWKASLDGKEVPIKLANIAFRSVYVPEGKHVLKMSYQPDSLKKGALISIFSIVGLLIVARFLPGSSTKIP